MARKPNQKLKLLYLMKILCEATDETHSLTLAEISGELAKYGVGSERKSLYDDLELLKLYGLDIRVRRDRQVHYYLSTHRFSPAELKLLIDAVQSSKAVTMAKSMELIRKLEGMGSRYEAAVLHEQVDMEQRLKAANEEIFANVATVYQAIARNRKIRCRYFEWNARKQRLLRHEGQYYQISPWALTWCDENYYLIAFDSEAGKIKHFRVDKMLDIGILDEPRDGRESFAALDMAEYAKKVFGMFSGREERVRMRFDNQLVGAVLDRLGREAMLVPDGESHFTVTAQVEVSPQFFAWVSGFGRLAQILGPDHVVQAMRAHAAEVLAMYE